MIDPATLHRIGYAALFALIAALVLFTRVLPLQTVPGSWPPPDLIALSGFAWVVRRPDYVPVVLFAGLMFLTDLMFLRPPGLHTALAVVILERLRGRSEQLREQSFAYEWGTLALYLALAVVVERAALAILFVAQPGFGLSVIELIVNIIAYPAVVAVSLYGFRVERLAVGTHASEARIA